MLIYQEIINVNWLQKIVSILNLINKSIVAKKHCGEITLYPKWDYSRTTAKHVGQWLELSCAEIRTKIKEGKIKVEEHEPEI